MSLYDKFEEIFYSYVNGQDKQWKSQLKRLPRKHRAECIDYIRSSFDEDIIAHNIAMETIKGL